MNPRGPMKKAALAALIAGCALATAGCSSAAQTPAATANTPAASESTASETFEPLVPDATEQAEEATTEVADEDTFLRANRASLHGVESIDDAQLVAAGYEACRQMESGISYEEVEVFAEPAAGEPVENWNDMNLAGLASETLCPALSVTG